ncbi:MAG: hypothetical protein WDN31_15345 [Hyphomicrobium sp.]
MAVVDLATLSTLPLHAAAYSDATSFNASVIAAPSTSNPASYLN